MMDIAGLQKAIDKLNKETLPRLEKMIERLAQILEDDVHEFLDRIDGARLKAEISIPPRGASARDPNK